MVFRRWSKASPEQLRYEADRKQYLDKYWKEFYEGFEVGDRVYAPLWDKEGLVEDVCRDFISVSGLSPDDWIAFFQHWELEKL